MRMIRQRCRVPVDSVQKAAVPVLFVDGKKGRGGGQVVLEELLRRVGSAEQAWLLMPEAGGRAIHLPSNTGQARTWLLLGMGRLRFRPMVIVANSNSAFPGVVLLAFARRLIGLRSTTVAIVHNYPSAAIKGAVTKVALRFFTRAVVVEPGLLALRPDAVVPAWLAPHNQESLAPSTFAGFTGVVRTWGRPDRSKGLDMLPQLFTNLAAAGIKGEVALGQALDGDTAYGEQLRRNLAPWLVSGTRGPSWLAPGDIFLVTSRSGEAACLSAQEAILRGCAVVAPRLGLMPYLSPTGEGVRTYSRGDVGAALSAIWSLAGLSSPDFAAETAAASSGVRARDGLWYEHVESIIRLAVKERIRKP